MTKTPIDVVLHLEDQKITITSELDNTIEVITCEIDSNKHFKTYLTLQQAKDLSNELWTYVERLS